MKITPNGIDLIKSFEGISDGDPNTYLIEPVLCPAGFWTVGYGHVLRHPETGVMLNSKNASKADIEALFPEPFTREQVEEFLIQDIEQVEKALNTLIKVKLNRNQWDAIVSLVFNIGVGAFSTSTLLKKLNKKDFDGAAKEFSRWKYSSKEVLPGLERRREAERMLFCRPLVIVPKPLTESRTVVGSLATATTGVLTVMKESGMTLGDLDPKILNYAGIVLGALIIGFALYVIYARWTDRKRGYK